jgi:hypothetical protein
MACGTAACRSQRDFTSAGSSHGFGVVVRPARFEPESDVVTGVVPSFIGMAAFPRVPEPSDGDERSVLLGWLAFHRNALEAKCAGLDAEQLATRSVPPSPLSLLGVVRLLTEMERVYAVWALGPKSELRWVWGEYTDDGPEWDIDADASMLADSMTTWEQEKRTAHERIRQHRELDSIGPGNGRSLRWNLQKLVGEYARHDGHADLRPLLGSRR